MQIKKSEHSNPKSKLTIQLEFLVLQIVEVD
jgi:hypothetical protein